MRKALLFKALAWLQELLDWFDAHPTCRFYSSSVLFCWDPSSPSSALSMRMIDFAHVFPIQDGGKDDGYLVGLRHLISMLLDLVQE